MSVHLPSVFVPDKRISELEKKVKTTAEELTQERSKRVLLERQLQTLQETVNTLCLELFQERVSDSSKYIKFETRLDILKVKLPAYQLPGCQSPEYQPPEYQPPAYKFQLESNPICMQMHWGNIVSRNKALYLQVSNMNFSVEMDLIFPEGLVPQIKWLTGFNPSNKPLRECEIYAETKQSNESFTTELVGTWEDKISYFSTHATAHATVLFAKYDEEWCPRQILFHSHHGDENEG